MINRDSHYERGTDGEQVTHGRQACSSDIGPGGEGRGRQAEELARECSRKTVGPSLKCLAKVPFSSVLLPPSEEKTTLNERSWIMADEDDLWALEERFWTKGADSARNMTAKGAVFIFPYPAGILQGDSLWRESRVAQRWRSIVLTERYLKQEKDVAVLAYQVSAERCDIPIYEALCTSCYLQDDGKWLRIAHQQTPVP